MKDLIQLVEAIDPPKDGVPTSWRVKLIRTGLSKNGNHYSNPVLVKAVNEGLFDGVRAQARSDASHVKNVDIDTRNLVGWFDKAKMVDNGVEAVFEAEEPWVAQKMWRAWQKGKKDYFGFSIVAEAEIATKRSGGRTYRDIQNIRKVHFVDVVVNPSAGARLLVLLSPVHLMPGGKVL